MVVHRSDAKGATQQVFEAGPPTASVSQKIAWISLDPQSGSIHPYPPEVARVIEKFYQDGEAGVNLGAKVVGYLGHSITNAAIGFKSDKTGQPFRVTPTGRRDVYR